MMVGNAEVDIIYIASPHAFHAEYALLCMNNKKPVLCEKALEINQSEVELMVKSARENGVLFMAASGVGTDIFCEKGTLHLRRLNAVDQWLEIEKQGSEPKRLNWDEKACGLKLEATEAMRCLGENRLQSNIMSHSMSLSLIKTLDKIRKEAGIIYPGKD